MRAINSGNTYHIYDNSVQLFNGLPAKVYGVDFDKTKGFFLYAHADIVISEKIYGVHESKVTKVMSAFKSFGRSLGVILSGDKGIGKSLFAKLLCCTAVSEGYPVIIVDSYYPGIAHFLDSIDQEVIVLFDEFDKTFKKSNDDDAPDVQAAMLSLFDGTSMNKKLFCVTCNETRNLNNFLVNRPGRFHYHFRFEYPSSEEIEVYMRDHLPEEKYAEISKVVDFARKVDLNYDCLRAISYELSRVATFEEAISDLNILKPDYGQPVKLFVLFDDGTRFSETIHIDLFSSDEEEYDIGSASDANDEYLTVKFAPADAMYAEQFGGYYLPSNRIKVSDMDIVNDNDSWIMRNRRSFVEAHLAKNVAGIVIKPCFNRKSIHYYTA
jgi:predicted AAA+ superfamily ATPase